MHDIVCFIPRSLFVIAAAVYEQTRFQKNPENGSRPIHNTLTNALLASCGRTAGCSDEAQGRRPLSFF